MIDARERFLREIAGRLPPERIEEVHLFPPLRQGGIESGVAVLAVEPEVAEVAALAGPERAERVESAESAERVKSAESTELAAHAHDAGEAPGTAPPRSPELDAAVEQLPLANVLADAACDPTEAAAGPPPARGRERPVRHTVYTARYRHTLKGPERGRWEFELVAEAEAPLITVETVVRGVQKRTGEIAEPERLTPDDLRTALDDTPWRATTG